MGNKKNVLYLSFRNMLLLAGGFIFVSIGMLLWQNTKQHPKHIAISQHKKMHGSSVFPQLVPQEIITHGDRNKKLIALTFDADMTVGMKQMLLSGKVRSWYDKKLIDVLRTTHTEATLFLTGMWIELYSDVTKELAKDPLFEVANHSYSHPSFDGYCYGLKQIADIADKEEVEHTQDLLKSVAGVDNHYFRFPGGCYSTHDLEIMKELGMEVVHWDVIADDGFNTNMQSIITKVLSRTQNGSIIVMHMNGYPNEPKTAEAVPVIIDSLKRQGFTFVTIDELLGKKPSTSHLP